MFSRFLRHVLRFSFCSLLIFGLLLSVGCSRSTPTPSAVLDALCAAEVPLPAGRVYLLGGAQANAHHADGELLAALFGGGILPGELGEVEDAAFYLSFSHPCEFSVFLCKSADGTDAVAKMCLRRLDFLRSYRGEGDGKIYAENASVTVRGRWVLLCVSNDSEGALRAFRQAF